MADTICRISGCLIQHGPCNDRVYMMKLGSANTHSVISSLMSLAREHHYSKIVAKVPSRSGNPFLEAGFIEEARIPRFFPEPDDGLFLSRFFSATRRDEQNSRTYDQIVSRIPVRREEPAVGSLPPGYSIHSCSAHDADDLARFYAAVFSSYPFPIHDAAHIRTMMGHATRFYAVIHNQDPAAAASAEMDPTTGTVEMTDFATSPGHRGRGLARRLLSVMEDAARDQGMRVAYTIARAGSPAMNAVFARAGYCFGGRLANNTHIGGSLESMNVWYKDL